MLKNSNSRGQKQRIKKKIDRLQGTVADKPSAPEEGSEPKKKSAKERVQNLMKKREKKMEDKKDMSKKKLMHVEDQKIVK